MKIKSLVLGGAVALALAFPAASSDVKVKPRVVAKPDVERNVHLCKQGRRIFTEMSFSEIVEHIYVYHDEAVATAEASIASRSMRYNWALETKAWCGSAIGYSKTRTLDEETFAKCACFHWTMINLR